MTDTVRLILGMYLAIAAAALSVALVFALSYVLGTLFGLATFVIAYPFLAAAGFWCYDWYTALARLEDNQ